MGVIQMEIYCCKNVIMIVENVTPKLNVLVGVSPNGYVYNTALQAFVHFGEREILTMV
jgi:hypothetical protein